MSFSNPLQSCMVLSVALCVLTVGCGRNLPETAPVSGMVTVDGKPVSEGKVIFYPEEGRPAIGEIESDGTYQLTTFEKLDGALLGKHTVTIKSSRVTGIPKAQEIESFEQEVAQASRTDVVFTEGVIEWIVPEQYSRRDSTPLERQVQQGDNQIDFELASDEAPP